MTLIAEGSYLLGAPAYRSELATPHPWRGPHLVEVDAFEIGVVPVTRGEYAVYLEEGGAPPAGWEGDDLRNTRMPVSGVSWRDAVEYTDWLSKRSGGRYRLPTAAEWEVAARGGLEGMLFPWGDEEPAGRCCFGLTEEDGPQEVASYSPNGYGLYDSAGCVWEWCLDLFVEASDDEPRNAPTGGDPHANRVLRGGSFLTPNRTGLYVAYLHEDPPDLRHVCIGMRLVRER